MIVVTSRFPARLAAEPGWLDTEITRARLGNGITRWRDLLTGRVLRWHPGDALPVQDVLRDLPVTVLVPAE